MPGKRTITLPDGRQIEATVLGFRAGGEHWNEYLLDDGSIVKIKLVATDVVRLDGEYDPSGNPVYLVQSTNVMAVDAPENLRRGGAEE
jgi:hypothetical protein